MQKWSLKSYLGADVQLPPLGNVDMSLWKSLEFPIVNPCGRVHDHCDRFPIFSNYSQTEEVWGLDKDTAKYVFMTSPISSQSKSLSLKYCAIVKADDLAMGLDIATPLFVIEEAHPAVRARYHGTRRSIGVGRLWQQVASLGLRPELTLQ